MIYLDANASSKLRPAVKEFLASNFEYLNPSSVHLAGRKTRADLRESRETILNFLQCPKAELIFTSGGTESCNLMLKGFLGELDCEIVTSSMEHSAVKELLDCEKVINIEPEKNGVINVNKVVSSVTSQTQAVCIMMVNNETGMMQPILELSTKLRQSGYKGLILSDAVQALGKTRIDIGELFENGLDAISISGHKVGALSGIGALIYNKNSEQCRMFSPQIVGGAQQKGFRAGTENVLGAICFGVAIASLSVTIDSEISRKKELSLKLLEQLQAKLEGVHWYGTKENWLGNTLLLGFENCLGSDLVAALDINGVAISTGAACASGKQGVSDTVNALENDPIKAKEVVRISLDWDIENSQIDEASEIVTKCVKSIRTTN